MCCGARPGVRLGDHVGNAVAGEGELAGEMAVGVLVDHAADVVRIERREHPVHHHLRHRDLPAHRFVARFEIDRVGETFLRLGARRPGERQPLGRRFRTLIDAGDFAFAGDGLAGFVVAARLRRRERRLLDVGIDRRHHHRRLARRPWRDLLLPRRPADRRRNRRASRPCGRERYPRRTHPAASTAASSGSRGELVFRVGIEAAVGFLALERRIGLRLRHRLDRPGAAARAAAARASAPGTNRACPCD